MLPILSWVNNFRHIDQRIQQFHPYGWRIGNRPDHARDNAELRLHDVNRSLDVPLAISGAIWVNWDINQFSLFSVVDGQKTRLSSGDGALASCRLCTCFRHLSSHAESLHRRAAAKRTTAKGCQVVEAAIASPLAARAGRAFPRHPSPRAKLPPLIQQHHSSSKSDHRLLRRPKGRCCSQVRQVARINPLDESIAETKVLPSQIDGQHRYQSIMEVSVGAAYARVRPTRQEQEREQALKTTSPIPFAGSQLDEMRHVCAFFNSADEEYRVLMPFITEWVRMRPQSGSCRQSGPTSRSSSEIDHRGNRPGPRLPLHSYLPVGSLLR